MSKKCFVGGLSWDTTNVTLRQAFEPYGTVVEANVITDRETGRSRGFGFVTFEDEDQARAAIEALNGTQLDGRTVKVDMAEDKPRRDGGGGRGGYGGGGRGGYGGGGGRGGAGGGRGGDRW